MAERIVFSRSLYSEPGVRAAVEAFAELARLELVLGNDDIVVELSDPDPDVAAVLADELCNHALAETVTRARG